MSECYVISESINDWQSVASIVSSANSYKHLVNNVLSDNNVSHDLLLYLNVNVASFVNASAHNVTCCCSVANVKYVLNKSWHASEFITFDVADSVVHKSYNVSINYVDPVLHDVLS